MPHLPYSIELHDSVAASATVLDGALVINFAPAYVHRDGKGWLQNARLVLHAAIVEAFDIGFPETLSNGDMQTGDGPYHNLLMLPLHARGPVSLEFEFCSGEILRATGDSVDVELLGEPIYVEDFGKA
jgi:hypothetical protein